MPQDDALLNEVLADPDSDGPRLTYAAQMDARGDVRGQFIRTQLRLAEFDAEPDAPTRTIHVMDSRSYLQKHGAEWAAGIAPLVREYEFHRGFIAHVTLNARDFLDRAPQLFSLEPIQHLDLKLPAGVAQELFASPHLGRIRSLDLNQGLLTDADIRLLADSKQVGELRWLSLAFNRMTQTGAEYLAASKNLPKLRYVDFTGNPVDPSEQYSQDQGVIVDKWLGRVGRSLEEKYGRIPWLHISARTTDELPPNRYIA